MNDEIHDTSRVDAFMASRRRAMFLHAIWRPVLAGAAGAAIIVATVWAASPRFHYNDIEIPRITQRDVTVDHVVPRDVPVDHVVPHDVPVDHIVPHDVPMLGPQASAPAPQASAPEQVASTPTPLGPADAPRTPAEKKFSDRPDFAKADMRGRIIHSVDGISLSFDTGKNWYPHDKSNVADSEPLIGDLAYCTETPKDSGSFFCFAVHNGKVISVPQKRRVDASCSSTSENGMPILVPRCAPNSASGTPPAMSTVNVDVDVAGYPVSAMVDTGCSWPMAIPRILADTLVREGLAALTSPAKSMLADGKVKDVDVIVINQITVDGRTLHDVLASVAPGDDAPILLGLGALNRLGQFSITDGRIVFTGDQPA
jgi:hypothetical protein